MPFSVRLAQNLYRWGYWGPPGCLLVRVRSQVPPVRAKWITVTQERERVSFEKLARMLSERSTAHPRHVALGLICPIVPLHPRNVPYATVKADCHHCGQPRNGSNP